MQQNKWPKRLAWIAVIVVIAAIGAWITVNAVRRERYRDTTDYIGRSSSSAQEKYDVFTSLGNYEDAPLIADIYRKLSDGLYPEALEAYRAYRLAGHDAIDDKHYYQDVLTEFERENSFALFSAAYLPVMQMCLESGAFGSSPMSYFLPNQFTGRLFQFADTLKETAALCGADPQGRALVYCGNRGEGAVFQSPGVSVAMTATLAERFIPEALAQVEYIIVLEYEYKLVGQYEGGIKGYSATIHASVIGCPSGELLFDVGGKSVQPDSLIGKSRTTDVYASFPNEKAIVELLDEAQSMLMEWQP